MAEPVISIKKLGYRYRGQKERALEDISLDISQGDFLVVMGPSEAGKSTLAATINGLVPHFFRGKFEGQVDVCGKNTQDHTVAVMAEEVGMVFQDFEAQLFSTNVELEVAFGPENFAVPRDEIERRIEKNLHLVGLEEYRNRPPSTLSGGQKQKLAIASVLAMQPKILVMDEPTTDLDPISKLGVFNIADQLRQRDDMTLIVVEHETEEALKARHILLLNKGKVIRYGPGHEVLRDVDLLESNGVRPLDIVKYFHQMGETDLPLTPEDGLSRFHAKGWRISDAKHTELVAKDKARAQQYGDIIIRCQGLKHSYHGKVEALRGVDLEIHRGEMIAIVGQN